VILPIPKSPGAGAQWRLDQREPTTDAESGDAATRLARCLAALSGLPRARPGKPHPSAAWPRLHAMESRRRHSACCFFCAMAGRLPCRWHWRSWWPTPGVRELPASWQLGSVLAIQSAVGYWAIAEVLRRRLNSKGLFADRRGLINWVTITVIGTLLNSLIFIAGVTVAGILPPAAATEALAHYWLGDLVGILMSMPLLGHADGTGAGRARLRRLWLGRESVSVLCHWRHRRASLSCRRDDGVEVFVDTSPAYRLGCRSARPGRSGTDRRADPRSASPVATLVALPSRTRTARAAGAGGGPGAVGIPLSASWSTKNSG
jgi:hypothetical protein